MREIMRERNIAVTDREKKEHQEQMLFENFLAQAVLAKQGTDVYQRYLRISSQRFKSGMSAEEIEAVQKRAEEASKDLQP